MTAFAEQVVVVTGGGSGMGLAIARMFLQGGAKVAIAGRNEAKLREATTQLGGGDHLLAVPTDVADPASVRQLVEQTLAQFGPIDILVNNAGTNLKERTIRELTPERWQMLIRTNLDGAFYCMHAVLPGMIERKQGLIININSISGKRAVPLAGAAYAASKFGMAALGICVGAEEKDSNIRVTNIYPGEVDTPILEFRPKAVTNEQRAVILQPEDVAEAVRFVASLPPRANVPELVIKPTAHTFI